MEEVYPVGKEQSVEDGGPRFHNEKRYKNNTQEIKSALFVLSFLFSFGIQRRVNVMVSFTVMFAYEQGLLCLGHHPDMWIEAASYLEHSSRLLTEKGVFICCSQ